MVSRASFGRSAAAVAASLELVEKPLISLARVPPLVPGRGLVWSGALHVATIATLALSPLFFPVDLPVIAPLRGDFIEVAHSESISLPNFFHTYDAGSQAAGASKRSGGSSRTKRTVPSPALPARLEVSSSMAPAFSGAQEIVSDLPDATNSVQTIRRPDLPSPPKLKFPQLLQSVIAGPPVEAPPPIAPQAVTTPAEIVAVEEKIIVKPSLVVPAAQRHAKEISTRAPKVNMASAATPPLLDVHPRVLPSLRMEVQTIASKTAVIINAITVPSATPVRIPDAELSGHFSVTSTTPEPSKVAAIVSGEGSGAGVAKPGTSIGTAAGDSDGATKTGTRSVAGAGTSKVSGHGGAGAATAKGLGTGTGIGTGSGIGPGNLSGATGTGKGLTSGTSNSTASHLNGRGAGAGTGAGLSGSGLPGITIMGGSGGRSGRSTASAQRSTRPGYDITIISGGSSGGASRDTGIFSRSETVYSVYIRMNDAGGGPDWSMQYALLGTSPGGNGMLTPPVAVKKMAALVARDPTMNYDDRIFVAGTISETGELTGLKAIRAVDDPAKAAVSALQQWQFLPAQLDGRAVPAKVLIGVTLIAR